MLESRLKKVRASMKTMGIDQLLVTSPQNLQYLTDTQVNALDRLNALILGQEKAVLVCYMLARVEAEGMETVIYEDSEKTAEALSPYLEPGSIGVDGSMASRFLLPLQALRPDLRFTYAKCVESARCIKDAEEIRCLRHASEVTDEVFAMAFAQMREGMTELDMSAVFSDCFARLGAGRFPGDPMVAMGSGTADVHHVPGYAKLKKGDPVMVDTGKQIGGYYSDMTRTVFFREPTEEMRRVYDVVLRANQEAMAVIRPGITLRSVHDIATRIIREAGYGAYFGHRTSHGIGIDFHEEPFDTDSHTVVLEPGMCFSVEPGIYLPGKFGVRIEDLVAVTEDGFELLSHMDRSLTVL